LGYLEIRADAQIEPDDYSFATKVGAQVRR
jgi:hypothetical protein